MRALPFGVWAHFVELTHQPCNLCIAGFVRRRRDQAERCEQICNGSGTATSVRLGASPNVRACSDSIGVGIAGDAGLSPSLFHGLSASREVAIAPAPALAAATAAAPARAADAIVDIAGAFTAKHPHEQARPPAVPR